MPPRVQGALALIFATLPLVIGMWALATMRPLAARIASDRALILSARPSPVAARYPGRPAVSLAALPILPRLDQLPFDKVILGPEVARPSAEDLAGQGFVFDGKLGESRAFVRQPFWSLLDEWPRWQIQVWHRHETTSPAPCPHRFLTGGYGCGHGVRIVPDLATVDEQSWGVARFTRLPAASRIALTTHFSPAADTNLAGRLIPLGSLPAVLVVSRGRVSRKLTCQRPCSLVIPAGDGPIVLSTDGPNPPMAVSLRVAP